MTSDLGYLLALAVFSASLWIPYIVGANMYPPEDRNAGFVRPPDLRQFPAWVHRAHRAQANLAENFGPFAAMVLMAHVLGVGTGLFSFAVAAFFWLRIAHAAGMISGYARFPLRPVIFSLGWIALMIMAWQIAANTAA